MIPATENKIDYKKELNERQLQAVFSTEGPHLVIAGAGSGKTRVLVFRTAYLVEKGVSPQQVLLLTFTRRAAQEMLGRASKLLDERCRKVSGGTFHSFAHLILRRYGRYLNLPNDFSILDQSDSENAVNLIRAKKELNKMDKRFPKKQALYSIISKSVNKCCDIELILSEEFPHFSHWAEAISDVQKEYVQYKRNLNLLDYDDLLIFLKDLLEEVPSLREKISSQYHYIMVDEYQDTNRIQAQIITLLTSQHKNIMVVGDDSQSIYSFRGAHFKNIIEFPQKFPGTKIIVLEENYRSSQPILDLTNEVIRYANEKYEKQLFTRTKGKKRPTYVDTINENGQSKYVVRKILELQEEGVPLHEIAVLFRSGWHSNDLEVELSGAGIPFLKFGGKKFVEAAHIKDVMSYLRVAYNPLDEVCWLRILTLMRGVGVKTASHILEEVIRKKKIFDIDARLLEKNNSLKRLFQLFQTIDIDRQPLDEILNNFLGFYFPLIMDNYDDYDKRLNDLESLQRIASRYSSLDQFLADMTLEPPEKSIVDAGLYASRKSKLVLSTIHSAKGLEWHTVFLIYLAEGYLPSYRSFDNEEAIEEERRLFYVATTRAKRNLFLLRPQIDRSPRNSLATAGSIYTRVSRFIDESRILNKLVSIEEDFSGYLSPHTSNHFY